MLSHVLGCMGVLLVGAGLWTRSRERPTSLVVPSKETYRLTVGQDLGDDSDRLWTSVEGLRAAAPEMAVHKKSLSQQQQQAAIVAITVLGFFFAISWNITLMILIGVIIALYFASLAVRLWLFAKGLDGGGLVTIDDDVARSIPAARLPMYTVLVPAYGEPEVMASLIGNLRGLDYPSGKLQVLLLLEADDTPTIAAAREHLSHESDITIVEVPPGGPRTKPKALNYGLELSSGDIVTIFDAEDRPEPLQLRKAAIALTTSPADVVCVQARLDFFNPTQNMLTKWFTLDYRMWFTQLLPGLVQLDAPIPLGGTSNHFRRSALLEVGAWDPYNVTEDADLGVRLHRLGYRTGVIDSVTYEEANSDAVNWVKQRSRWYKGYAQTALVHLRHPAQLYRDLGPKSFALFALFVGGTPLLAMLNPVFWGLTLIWWVFHPHWLHQIIPSLTYFVGQFCWLAGNGVVLYSWMLSTRQPRERLWLAAVLAPFYWMLMAVAATKAMVQLITAPSYWEKTQHGLDTATEPVAA